MQTKMNVDLVVEADGARVITTEPIPMNARVSIMIGGMTIPGSPVVVSQGDRIILRIEPARTMRTDFFKHIPAIDDGIRQETRPT